MHSTMVSQLSHDRLPLTISVNWNAIVTSPAMAAYGCGAMYAKGTPISTTWLIFTPERNSTTYLTCPPSCGSSLRTFKV